MLPNYKTPEYKSWSAMKQRCYWAKHKHFALYGGRGIKVCERWLNSFENFLTDMGPRPSLKHSIDRFPDKDGDYKPGNCRWATQSEQNRNRARYKHKTKRLRRESSLIVDLIGQQFDRLAVISKHPMRRNGQVQWVCRCTCGNEKTVRGHHLRSGQTKSCGCLRVDHAISLSRPQLPT